MRPFTLKDWRYASEGKRKSKLLALKFCTDERHLSLGSKALWLRVGRAPVSPWIYQVSELKMLSFGGKASVIWFPVACVCLPFYIHKYDSWHYISPSRDNSVYVLSPNCIHITNEGSPLKQVLSLLPPLIWTTKLTLLPWDDFRNEENKENKNKSISANSLGFWLQRDQTLPKKALDSHSNAGPTVSLWE